MSQDIKKPVFGNAAAPEFVRVNGKLQVRDGIRVGFTRCFTCNNMCGLRYRVDEKTNTVTRVAGNPYCEVVSGGKPLPLNTPVEKAFEMLTGDAGLEHRATVCGKGSSGPDSITDPRRVTQVLKRAGKRGENKWKTISYEQAVKEIVEGGNLFGEGHVDGLRKIRDLKTPARKGYPEFGTAANQLFATFNEEDTMRGGFYRRFITQAFGSVNLCTNMPTAALQSALAIRSAWPPKWRPVCAMSIGTISNTPFSWALRRALPEQVSTVLVALSPMHESIAR